MKLNITKLSQDADRAYRRTLKRLIRQATRQIKKAARQGYSGINMPYRNKVIEISDLSKYFNNHGLNAKYSDDETEITIQWQPEATYEQPAL